MAECAAATDEQHKGRPAKYNTDAAGRESKMRKIDLSTATTPEERRDQIRDQIRQRIPCTDYLQKARKSGFICDHCGSGTKDKGTGAVVFYPETNTCTCFACGQSFDVIDLIQLKHGCDYSGALAIGAELLGIDFNAKTARKTGPASDLKGAGDKISTDVDKSPETAGKTPDFKEYYQACRERLTDPAAISYLTARGISQETAKKFWIGYDPAADPASAPGAMGDEYRPHPCPRLIIPVNHSYYVARRTDGGAEFKKLFPKGGKPAIFNIKKALENDVVFITEGAIDALSIIEVGGCAIALNSTNNADLFIKTLREQAPDKMPVFIIALDNDDAGKEATRKIRAGFDEMGIRYTVKNICGAAKDPNDALMENRAEFTRAAKAAIEAADAPQADYMLDFLGKILTEAYKPYTTELSFFDDLLNGGVIRQTLLLLLAAPGTGKTTLCAQIAEQMAAHQKPVIYFNLEMSREQMIAKAISARLARKGKKITALEVMQGYNWTKETRDAVICAIDEYREKIQPYLSFNPDGIGGDLDAIRDYLRRTGDAAKAAGKEAPVIILDYLHLISSRAGLDNQELIKQAVTALKQYAIDYNTFVIGIVATNRASNTAGKITMESGRDSSNLEYTADYQLSLNYYDIDNGKVSPTEVDKIAELQRQNWRQMIIRVLKGRFCQPGRSAKVYFNAASNIFYGENDFMPADPERIPFENTTYITASF